MPKIFFLILGALLILAPAASAAEIVVLQSSRLRPYAEAREGLESALAGLPLRGIKSISPAAPEVHVLTEEDPTALARTLEGERPEVLIAIGSSALAFAERLPAAPLVYLLAPNPDAIIGRRAGATGVLMAIPPGRQLAALKKALPAARRVGVVCHSGHSGKFMREAEASARQLGLKLVVRHAESPREEPALLEELLGEIDVFWLLPDVELLTPRIVDEVMHFSIRNTIPVLTFTEKHLGKGAAVAVTFDPAAMGEQAGELARRILQGNAELPPLPAERIRVEINRKVLEKMNIPFAAPEADQIGDR